MGVYASIFEPLDGEPEVAKSAWPAQPKWIEKHAEAVGMSELEVARLWERFQRLGCNRDGVLERDVIEHEKDFFLKNQLRSMAEENGDGNIPFQNFCLYNMWLQTADTDVKVKAIYHLLNNGDPIFSWDLEPFLAQLYPNEDKRAIDNLAVRFVRDIGGDENKITEAKWCEFFSHQPTEVIDLLVYYRVIPHPVRQQRADLMDKLGVMPPPEDKRRVSESRERSRPTVPINPSDKVAPREERGKRRVQFGGKRTHQLPSRSIWGQGGRKAPSEQLLRTVSSESKPGDWELLAPVLGCSSKRFQQLQKQQVMDKDKMLNLLLDWKQEQAHSATVSGLQRALQAASLSELSDLVAQHKDN